MALTNTHNTHKQHNNKTTFF